MILRTCRYPGCTARVTADGDWVYCGWYHQDRFESGMQDAREVQAELELQREDDDG